MNTFARTKCDSGQTATEFLLVAPLLFFIFFAITQTAYTAYVAFAVQRAALAVARVASLSGVQDDPNSKDLDTLRTQLTLSLLPLVRLNSKTLPTILGAQSSVLHSSDLKEVIVRVRYPMPILVPMMGRILGTSFPPVPISGGTSAIQSIRSLLSLLSIPIPDPASIGPFPVFWVTYEVSTFNEAYRKTSRSFSL